MEKPLNDDLSEVYFTNEVRAFSHEDLGKLVTVHGVRLTGWRYWWARFRGKPTERTVRARVAAVATAD